MAEQNWRAHRRKRWTAYGYRAGAGSKSATAQQSNSLKTYLRKLVANYQQAACDNLTDAELNELLQLSATAQDRPDSYKLPSVADLAPRARI